MKGKDMVKLLKQHGWKIDRIKGSHHVMKKGIAQPDDGVISYVSNEAEKNNISLSKVLQTYADDA